MLKDAPATTMLPAVDVERAKKFYLDVLGLNLLAGGPADGAIFEAGKGTTLMVYERGQTKADNTAASFQVDNLETEMAELRTRGLKFEEYDLPNLKTVAGVATYGPIKSAWFKDTEGNILALTEIGA